MSSSASRIFLRARLSRDPGDDLIGGRLDRRVDADPG